MDEFTYDVAGCEYDLHFTRAGNQVLKQIFYDTDFRTIHTNYIIGDDGKRLIISMLKDPMDYIKLGREVKNPEALFLLLTEHPEFFRTPKNIILIDDGTQYKKIKELSFLD